MLICHIMTDAEREAVSAWRYPGDCAVYNLPPYALQKDRGRGGRILPDGA